MTELLTVEQIAQLLNVSRDYVYDHAEALGAMRLNDAPNGPLRFDPETVAAWLAERRVAA